MSGPGSFVRPDGLPEIPSARVRESFSVGQLMNLSDRNRRAVVERMPLEQRAALSDLARHGAERAMRDAARYTDLIGLLLSPDDRG